MASEFVSVGEDKKKWQDLGWKDSLYQEKRKKRVCSIFSQFIWNLS